jgi:hypothetical protein
MCLLLFPRPPGRIVHITKFTKFRTDASSGANAITSLAFLHGLKINTFGFSYQIPPQERLIKMKKIEWEEAQAGSLTLNPKLNQRPLLPGSPVKPQMQISAKYKGKTVYLRILEETNPGIFKVSVLDLNPPLPEDLNEGDEACIHRGNISCLFG